MPVTSSIERPPSLRDLARELNVSHTTVAMALKNDTRISFDVRRRVQAMAKKRGYFANEILRNLQTGRTNFIGVVVPDLRDNFYARMVEGMQEPLWETGKMPLILSSHGNLDREEAVLERYARLRAEGVLMVPAAPAEPRAHFVEVIKKSTTVVTLENSLNGLALPNVRADEAAGVILTTLHLLELEHRRIVFCSSNLDSEWAAAIRLQGFEQALDRTGLPIHKGRLNIFGGTFGHAAAALETLLMQPSRGRATALVAASDDTAAAVVELLGELGLRVPEDVSVTGFGNRTNRPGKIYGGPPLTTVDLMPEKIGREAVLILLNLLEEESRVPTEFLVEPELLQGASTTTLNEVNPSKP